MEIDVSLDGVDADDPQNQKRREYQPVTWTARQLAADYAELRSISESDLKHYCSTPRGAKHNPISRGR